MGLILHLTHCYSKHPSSFFEDKSRSKVVTDDFKENSYQSDSGFRQSQNEGDIKQIKENHVPKILKKHNWALQIWQQWATERLWVPMELGDDDDFRLEVCRH